MFDEISRIVECGAVQKCVNLVDLVKSFQTSIYFLLAKFGVDTAENGSLEVCKTELFKEANSYKQVRINIGRSHKHSLLLLQAVPHVRDCRPGSLRGVERGECVQLLPPAELQKSHPLGAQES